MDDLLKLMAPLVMSGWTVEFKPIKEASILISARRRFKSIDEEMGFCVAYSMEMVNNHPEQVCMALDCDLRRMKKEIKVLLDERR